MNVRIYKDNIRENIFRSLLFTDIVLFILAGVIVAIFIYALFLLLFHRVNIGYFLGTTVFAEISLYAASLIRIDNQPIYTIVGRAIPFTLGQKKFRSNQVDSYFKDFFIQDDLIIRKKSISKLFEIIPFDISAINIVERQNFFAQVKLALHSLPSQLQIVIRKQRATGESFNDHFFFLYKSLKKGDKKREAMVANYQKDLTTFIQHNEIFEVKQYGVFSLKADSTSPGEKVGAIGKLTDMYARLKISLESCNVQTRQLKGREIEQQIRRILR